MQHIILLSLLFILCKTACSVHPGDPFPTNRYQLRLALFRDENEDPHDEVSTMERGKLSNPIVNRTIEDRSSLISRLFRSTSPAPTGISKNNLIRINRWKFDDLVTNEIRYWYEPEGAYMGKGWVFDRVAFLAYSRHEFGTRPVFAFHSEIGSEWTNTLQLDYEPPLRSLNQWIADGISFYTYPTRGSSPELRPVWRFWNIWNNLTNLATPKSISLLVVETNDHQEENLGWIRDQIVFYALPFEH